MREVDFPVSDRVRRARWWLLIVSAVSVVLLVAVLTLAVATAAGWFEMPRVVLAVS